MGKILFKITEIVEQIVEKKMKKMYGDISALLTEIITSNIGAESKNQQNRRIVSMVRNTMGKEVSQPMLDAMHKKEASIQCNAERESAREGNMENELHEIQEQSDQEEEILERDNKRKRLEAVSVRQRSPIVQTRSKGPPPTKEISAKTTTVNNKDKGAAKPLFR